MKQQKEYREALQNRSIAPSEGSWEQLCKQLDTHEAVQKKSNKWVFLKYAASILLLVSASMFFFQPKEVITNTPIIVTPTLNEDVKIINEVNVEPAIKSIAESKVFTKKTEIKKLEKNAKNNIEIIDKSIAMTDISDTSISETIVHEIPENSSIVSKEMTLDNEVDQLLNNATKNQISKRQKVISANALLTEVEDDLDKDFKDKLIDNIVNTLKKPRVVITDRDH